MAAPPVIARTATYFHARVGRTELDKVFLVAGEGAPAGTVSVRCTVGNAHLQEDTLDDLNAARAALPYVSDRTPWTALTFERDEGAARYVSIEFEDGVVTVTVRSGDPIWTHGQAHRLGEILEEAHGAAEHRYRIPQVRQTALLMALVLMIWVPSMTYAGPRDFYDYLTQISGVGVLVLGGTQLVREWVNGRADRPVFKVTEDVQWGSTWSRLSSGDRIALVSAVIAGLTLIATAAALI
ncbi:hypothetical protein [Streptomyces olivochromogenes]|uniref:Uncharacterized protein n=1 Tax=Streptomyces olivochromogenes TaxID=1963 RepID=A0A250VF63_STROL|nr:hypothetical protein [Streptomyces olivochromogenes]KUN47427.1 hypothetical protein AQJ27_10855 [Streptomyces olivochromogenes]GAX52843.1 hypothetical protein SO3561_04362 [Streptomyces olivochromogenes]